MLLSRACYAVSSPEIAYGATRVDRILSHLIENAIKVRYCHGIGCYPLYIVSRHSTGMANDAIHLYLVQHYHLAPLRGVRCASVTGDFYGRIPCLSADSAGVHADSAGIHADSAGIHAGVSRMKGGHAERGLC
eukprot:3698956-Rhodomonas_salina.1